MQTQKQGHVVLRQVAWKNLILSIASLTTSKLPLDCHELYGMGLGLGSALDHGLRLTLTPNPNPKSWIPQAGDVHMDSSQ